MRSRNGLTLIELVVVLSILAAVSSLMVPLFTGTMQDAVDTATRRTLLIARDAMCRYWADTKHVPLDGVTTVATEADRLQIRWLLLNPVTGDTTQDFLPNTRIGWRGPYVASATGGSAASPALVDAWNRAVVVQDVAPAAQPRDVRIVSGGPDGAVDIPAATATSALTAADVGDDVYVAFSLR